MDGNVMRMGADEMRLDEIKISCGVCVEVQVEYLTN